MQKVGWRSITCGLIWDAPFAGVPFLVLVFVLGLLFGALFLVAMLLLLVPLLVLARLLLFLGSLASPFLFLLLLPGLLLLSSLLQLFYILIEELLLLFAFHLHHILMLPSVKSARLYVSKPHHKESFYQDHQCKDPGNKV